MTNSVLIVLENYPAYGGVERVSTLLANYLCEQGWQVAIAALEGVADAALLAALDPAVLTERLPDRARAASAANRAALEALIARRGVTVVLNQGLHVGLTRISLAAAARHGCRHVGVLHNTPDALARVLDARRATLRAGGASGLKAMVQRLCWPAYRFLAERRMARFYRDAYRRSSCLVLLSERFGAPFAAMAGLAERGKIVCIPNPLTFDDEVDPGALRKEKRLIYIGRFDRTQKRVDRAVTIFKALRATYPDWQLELIGDGEQLAELRAMSAGIDAITFSGKIADPRAQLRRASILLLTSEFEGFGMVLTEALQFGVVPVAYASYAALPDIISDGANGYAIPAFDQDCFIARLAELMGDADKRAGMAAQAILSARRFSKAVVLPQWLPVLRGADANMKNST